KNPRKLRNDLQTMQKNLLVKSLVIIAVLLIFLFGIFGIPSGVSGDALREAVLNHIHLGLDLKGGTHLILQVMVNEAVAADSDHAIESLKDQLAKSNFTGGNIAKPDPDNHPDQILIQNLPLDAAGRLREIVRDNLPEYDVTGGPNNTWIVTMKPS